MKSSQSESIATSTAMKVMEQPAILREVTYDPVSNGHGEVRERHIRAGRAFVDGIAQRFECGQSIATHGHFGQRAKRKRSQF
jgi:hypothetical protein